MSLWTLTVVAVVVSMSCGAKKDDPGAPISVNQPAKPTPPAPGISQNLTRSDKPPMYHLDTFGSMNNPIGQKPFQLSADSKTLIMGWAIDGVTKQLPGGVDIVIDDSTFSAHTGTNRTDVADHFKRPEYTTSGFELTLPAGMLTKGDHTASIRVISSDKKTYYQAEVMKFSVN